MFISLELSRNTTPNLIKNVFKNDFRNLLLVGRIAYDELLAQNLVIKRLIKTVENQYPKFRFVFWQ